MDIQTLLGRRVAEVIDKKHLQQALKSKNKLRIKLGIDPNKADIHLGHAVTLWKLREFQEAGHKAVFIIGDWTAQIGDPSGKDATRPTLTPKEVQANAKHFFDQAYLILDKAETEIHLQSEWFKKLDLTDFIKLASRVSTSYILSHETFRNRLQKDLPFAFHETFYPFLQGYDSIAVKANVELGAMEQKFNLLMGRKLQRFYGQPPQDIMMMKYLIGLDGKEKMSKSLNNYVALRENAEEMFGKLMSIPDSLIIQYFELCTKVPEREINEFAKAIQSKSVNPKDLKSRLAREIVTIYHSQKQARDAEKVFEAKFGKNKSGAVKADFTLKKKPGNYPLINLLVEGGLAASKSEARRKVQEGAVEIDGNKIGNENTSVSIKKNSLIRLGKRFLRIN